ncbi:hypothetical protein J2Z83_003386 [Virgibacillus natechei]|uniref:Sigma-54 factor interaction domain-containing protein n=1 Tax=Virgibacillus natechei TaxID=1216297 RepID=A0ABS4IK02_9BACI|nr:hypothetical protein [Virgibacillus natechei]
MRILQEKEFERVGGIEKYEINTRIIAATNRNLKEMVEAGDFREDLFYRINVIELPISPLRKRTEDIPPLVSNYLNVICTEYQIPVKSISRLADLGRIFSPKARNYTDEDAADLAVSSVKKLCLNLNIPNLSGWGIDKQEFETASGKMSTDALASGSLKIWQDEIFAPVLSIVRVKDLDAAVEITNKSPFANGACIFTKDGGSVRQFRETIDAGMLGVNIGVPAPMAFFPFSGWKDSFYGDLHANGKDGLNFYTRKKVITTRWV